MTAAIGSILLGCSVCVCEQKPRIISLNQMFKKRPNEQLRTLRMIKETTFPTLELKNINNNTFLTLCCSSVVQTRSTCTHVYTETTVNQTDSVSGSRSVTDVYDVTG